MCWVSADGVSYGDCLCLSAKTIIISKEVYNICLHGRLWVSNLFLKTGAMRNPCGRRFCRCTTQLSKTKFKMPCCNKKPSRNPSALLTTRTWFALGGQPFVFARYWFDSFVKCWFQNTPTNGILGDWAHMPHLP